MRGRREYFGNASFERDGARIFIVAECRRDEREAWAVIADHARELRAATHILSFSAWLKFADYRETDMVVIVRDHVPEPRLVAAADMRARATPVLWVLPRAELAKIGALPSARARGFAAREDLSASSLEAALRALRCARDAERGLLGVVGDFSERLSRVRATAFRLGIALENPDIGGDDALAALRDTDASLTRALAGSRHILSPQTGAADLVDIFNSLLPDWARSEDGAVTALVSDGPIWVDAPARDLERLLSEVVTEWRRGRGFGDRLEWIVWDAGENARVAALLTQTANPEAGEDSLAHFAQSLADAIEQDARACRAGVEITASVNDRATISISFAKHGVALATSKNRAHRAEPNLVDHARD